VRAAFDALTAPWAEGYSALADSRRDEDPAIFDRHRAAEVAASTIPACCDRVGCGPVDSRGRQASSPRERRLNVPVVFWPRNVR